MNVIANIRLSRPMMSEAFIKAGSRRMDEPSAADPGSQQDSKTPQGVNASGTKDDSQTAISRPIPGSDMQFGCSRKSVQAVADHETQHVRRATRGRQENGIRRTKRG